jgi:hypothetical protein
VTIASSNGTQLYSNQFDDSDGILDLELIPSSSRSLSSSSSSASTSSNQTSLTSSSNQTSSATASASSSNQTTTTTTTTPNFVTWGPDLTDQQGVASDGVYHVQGPVMTENQDYTITVSITSIDNAAQQQPLSDDFLLPSANS